MDSNQLTNNERDALLNRMLITPTAEKQLLERIRPQINICVMLGYKLPFEHWSMVVNTQMNDIEAHYNVGKIFDRDLYLCTVAMNKYVASLKELPKSQKSEYQTKMEDFYAAVNLVLNHGLSVEFLENMVAKDSELQSMGSTKLIIDGVISKLKTRPSKIN